MTWMLACFNFLRSKAYAYALSNPCHALVLAIPPISMQIETVTADIHNYINRELEPALEQSLAEVPITGLLGPRQCGKSTMAQHVLASRDDRAIYLDLERPSHLRRLRDPELFLTQQKGKLVCLDEIQRLPDVFPLLRSLADDRGLDIRFLLLGSASPDLLKQSSESLAGRIRYLELTPFHWREMGKATRLNDVTLFDHWLRGGFPGSLLASSDEESLLWRESFTRTFLERDLPLQAGMSYSETLSRLWRMLAHCHGQLLNSSRLGKTLGISHTTVRNYTGLLEQVYMLRSLPPLHVNLKKRLIKAPKLYFRDSGILHSLLEIEDHNQLLGHPAVGASWEGWCIEQITAVLPKWRAAFYRDSNGQEIDLILERGERRLAFEFKATLSPELTRGGYAAFDLLGPEKSYVVCPMQDSGYELSNGIHVCGIEELLAELESL